MRKCYWALLSLIPSSSSIGSLTLLTSLYLQSNQLVGTIPSAFSKLISLSSLHLDTNYLTMGSATTVPASTFSLTTLGKKGTLTLYDNCLVFLVQRIVAYATHCAPTSGESLISYCMNIMSW